MSSTALVSEIDFCAMRLLLERSRTLSQIKKGCKNAAAVERTRKSLEAGMIVHSDYSSCEPVRRFSAIL
jgi:hypothetical protein